MTGSLVTARDSHIATLLSSGKVLVAGGFSPSDYLRSAELYDPATGTWTLTASMNAERSSPTATLLPSGQVLVAGGAKAGAVLSSAGLYISDRLSSGENAAGTASQCGSLGLLAFGAQGLDAWRTQGPEKSN